MIQQLARKVFGTQNDRELKSLAPIVQSVNALESAMKPLSDDGLKAKTLEFKDRLAKGERLDGILPEAFAVVREASIRCLGLRHYDVQIIGGASLHRGRIAEMKTGEGKTLVATLAVYTNALAGKGVHVVTVNDYLARRDAEQMGKLYGFLGLTVGVIVHGLSDSQRKKAYACDITYGTNNEFGFDYLRDNMKFRIEDYVQRELHFAVVDEVDSILIDEARTPLIISGPSEGATEMYYFIDRKLAEGGALIKDVDYQVDLKSRSVSLTEAGVDKMEKRLSVSNMYDPSNIEILHHVNESLRAHVIYKRDVDYVIRNGEVVIVDEFTGRLMPGRRWSDGLHQAIEAKENVKIEAENQTLATITFQNYFRMYSKLSGMTGTADTEATEFKQIYNLDVTLIPTNRPMIRADEHDLIFRTEEIKFKHIGEQIVEVQKKGQPVLVGTVSVEKSETIASYLKQNNIPHHILNAKQHEREAEIVAQAGRKGAVTISTNMAGRGTDILLGGNAEFMARRAVGLPPEMTDLNDPVQLEKMAGWEKKLEAGMAEWKELCERERKEVLEAGGLFILGTERHESRRIDNQLRGRAGRQGDPGKSRFFLSLDDDLMKRFGNNEMLKRLMEDDQPLEHKMVSRAIENAQRLVEAQNYDYRKHLIEYDDVMNQQRKIVYSWRRDVLGKTSLREMVVQLFEDEAGKVLEPFFPNGKPVKVDGIPHLDASEINQAFKAKLQAPIDVQEPAYNFGIMRERAIEAMQAAYQKKCETYGEETMHQIERMVLLTTIDQLWKDHLLAMDHLRQGIGLQGYGQKDPLVEYKKEGFRMFQRMMGMISTDCVQKLYTVQLSEAKAGVDESDDEELGG